MHDFFTESTMACLPLLRRTIVSHLNVSLQFGRSLELSLTLSAINTEFKLSPVADINGAGEGDQRFSWTLFKGH